VKLTMGYIYRNETENILCILGRGRRKSNSLATKSTCDARKGLALDEYAGEHHV
jgi:hypothetical protein